MQERASIILSANTAWNIYNFRLPLISALQKEGYKVVIIAPEDDSMKKLEALGCETHSIEMENSGTSISKDLKLLWQYYKRLQKIKAHAFLGFTVKPNVFGSIAAHLTGTATINNISGLGTVFIKKSWITIIVKSLYRIGLSRAQTVFFQNEDDEALFRDQKLVKASQTALLPGSGIDLELYKSHTQIATTPEYRFLLIARLLWDKGVGEYVDAAKIITAQYPNAIFQILGFLGVDNHTAVSKSDIDQWEQKGLIEYLGSTADVRPFIEKADCIVLPSYREGTPRSLLEGAALSRPLIATNVPGCRQVVDEGQTGFLCEVKSAESLARAVERFLELTPDQQREMGINGRLKMEHEYDVSIVTERYISAIKKITS